MPAGLVGLVVLLAAAAGAFAVVDAPASQSHERVASEHVPPPPHSGWRWVAYGSVRIGVPRSWVVEHGLPCPSPHHGTLELGTPRIVNCPEYGSTGNLVDLAPLPPIPAPPSGTVQVVHGVNLYRMAPLAKAWEAPALGLRIYATGPGATAVVDTLEPLAQMPPQ